MAPDYNSKGLAITGNRHTVLNTLGLDPAINVTLGTSVTRGAAITGDQEYFPIHVDGDQISVVIGNQEIPVTKADLQRALGYARTSGTVTDLRKKEGHGCTQCGSPSLSLVQMLEDNTITAEDGMDPHVSVYQCGACGSTVLEEPLGHSSGLSDDQCPSCGAGEGYAKTQEMLLVGGVQTPVEVMSCLHCSTQYIISGKPGEEGLLYLFRFADVGPSGAPITPVARTHEGVLVGRDETISADTFTLMDQPTAGTVRIEDVLLSSALRLRSPFMLESGDYTVYVPNPQGVKNLLEAEVEINRYASPTDVIFLVDKSGSMQGGKLDSLKKHILEYLETQRHDVSLAGLAFNYEVENLFGFTRIGDKDEARKASGIIAALKAEARTNIASGIFEAMTLPLEGNTRERVLKGNEYYHIVFFTDGEAMGDRLSPDQIAELGLEQALQFMNDGDRKAYEQILAAGKKLYKEGHIRVSAIKLAGGPDARTIEQIIDTGDFQEILHNPDYSSTGFGQIGERKLADFLRKMVWEGSDGQVEYVIYKGNRPVTVRKRPMGDIVDSLRFAVELPDDIKPGEEYTVVMNFAYTKNSSGTRITMPLRQTVRIVDQAKADPEVMYSWMAKVAAQQLDEIAEMFSAATGKDGIDIVAYLEYEAKTNFVPGTKPQVPISGELPARFKPVVDRARTVVRTLESLAAMSGYSTESCMQTSDIYEIAGYKELRALSDFDWEAAVKRALLESEAPSWAVKSLSFDLGDSSPLRGGGITKNVTLGISTDTFGPQSFTAKGFDAGSTRSIGATRGATRSAGASRGAGEEPAAIPEPQPDETTPAERRLRRKATR